MKTEVLMPRRQVQKVHSAFGDFPAHALYVRKPPDKGLAMGFQVGIGIDHAVYKRVDGNHAFRFLGIWKVG